MSEIQLIYWFFKRFKDCLPRILLEGGKYRAYAVQLGTMVYAEGETISDAIRKWYEDETLEDMKG